MDTDAEVTPGSQAALRRANRQRVIAALRDGGTLTQAEIARSTGLSAASVSNIVRDLRGTGVVSVRETSSNGRRARAVSLVRQPGVVVGIDFGYSRLRVALGDSEGRTLLEEAIGYDVAADPDRGVRRAVWLAETLLIAARVDRSMVTSVAAAVPGPIEAATGEIGSITCMPRWAGYRPAAELSERLGLPVLAENDANLAAMAEAAEGSAQGLEHVVHVTASEGVGAGLIVGGRLFRGAGGTAGEIGHMGLDERGQVCRCGNRGCLETLVGAPYLLNMVPHTADIATPSTLPGLVAAARNDDPGCRRIVAEAGAALGRGVSVVANTFNPQMVVVGGELAEAGELLLEPMRRAMEMATLGSALRQLRLVRGELGGRAALRGALRLALLGTAG
ncbi:ROK family transcriptional regulator [Marinitenerispora sediminis]|uniref:Transcriptional regulator n=1 Tax=Marinitenerispora sediminis TaxID=1931232 RepID=A0A368T9K3_9ACTN|nr:ROK family transcriptional regulator [Marinitenerispora sediminis]RCV52368.1 transcriptional regulator [Marinitenerispora sediminis]RCV60933.1 transcriptional regulator [Marinitenerispora sediminis]RCV62224.1 transcriptional regulator [Marinitenerispora sediminis]